MTTVDQIKSKVQRMLTAEFGTIRVNADGVYLLGHESANLYVEVLEWGEERVIVKVTCPLVADVAITPELTRWIAVEGQRFYFGSCSLNPNEDDEATGWVYFGLNLLGDDLDQAELVNAVEAVAFTGNSLDNEVQTRFGGKLFGADK